MQNAANTSSSLQLNNAWLAQAYGGMVATLAVLALGFPLQPISATGSFLAFLLSGLYGFIALMILLYARHAGKRLAAFAHGDFLAQWTYSEDEWNQYLQSEDHPKPANWLLIPGIAGSIGLAYGLVLCSQLAHHYWHDLPENDPRFFLFLLVSMGGTALCSVAAWYLGVLLRSFFQGSPSASQQRFSFIGKGGLYINGRFESWSSFGLYLSKVNITTGTLPSLQFLLTDIDDNFRSVKVPIPSGHEDEANKLVLQLSRTPGDKET